MHLYIGHTHLTHSDLMNGEDVPRCVACDCDHTVEHNLIECGEFAEVRQRYYDAENSQQLFQEISVIDILGMLYRIYRNCLFMITCE